MSKHTQGRWSYFKYPDTKTFTVAATGSIASKIRSEDDARLIAAAPELLVVLRNLTTYCRDYLALDDEAEAIVKDAFTVITKAEGDDK